MMEMELIELYKGDLVNAELHYDGKKYHIIARNPEFDFVVTSLNQTFNKRKDAEKYAVSITDLYAK